MKSAEFIRTIVESTSEWSASLDSAIAGGQITKRDWEDTKHTINRSIDKKREQIIKQYYFDRPEIRDNDLASDLYYSMAHDVNGLNTMKKAATKLGSDAFAQAALELYAEYAPLAAKLKELKPMIVTVTQQRAEKKETEKKAKVSSMDAASILVDLLKVHHDEYVDRAREMGIRQYNRAKSMMDEAGGLDAIAPRPSSTKNTREEYRHAMAKREFFAQIESTTAEENGESEAKHAHMAYMEWVHKLVSKIGKPIVKANVTGSPWNGSRITVTTNDGETQVWHTKMILNSSKYGKLFNQFPTRKEQ